MVIIRKKLKVKKISSGYSLSLYQKEGVKALARKYGKTSESDIIQQMIDAVLAEEGMLEQMIEKYGSDDEKSSFKLIKKEQ